MPLEKYTERERAVNYARSLFDTLVNRELAGIASHEVGLEWVATTDEAGETIEDPLTTVNGVPAEVVYVEQIRRVAPDLAVAVLTEGSQEFNNLMAYWGEALEYYKELDDLNVAINALAISHRYFQRAEDDATNRGMIGIYKPGDGELLLTARNFVKTDILAWGEAVEREKAAEDAGAEFLENYPPLSWVLVRDDNAQEIAWGGQNEVLTDQMYEQYEELYGRVHHITRYPELSPEIEVISATED